MVLDHNFPTDQRVEKEIDSLIKENHTVVLACFSYKREEPLFENKGNIKIYRKPISTLQYKTSVAVLRFPFYLSFWKKFISSIIKKENIDVIHIHDLPLAKVGVHFKKKLNIPLVIDLHENWPASMESAVHTNTVLGKLLSSNKQWRNYEKHILSFADAIITVIDEMKDRISKLGINSKNIFVVSNTINQTDIPVCDNKPDPKWITLFYAGGINIHRGLQVIINALPLIKTKKNNVRLFIVGKGSYQKYLEQLAMKLNIQDSVFFLGYKKREEMFKLLAKSDIALIPHLKSEQTDCSSPNKLYEYIHAKKPILTSNCNSLERIVKETKTGLSYVHNSPEDFTRALLEMLQSKNMIDLEYGFNLITTKYNWKVDSQNLIKLYNHLKH